jgi:hypothetical protein
VPPQQRDRGGVQVDAPLAGPALGLALGYLAAELEDGTVHGNVAGI